MWSSLKKICIYVVFHRIKKGLQVKNDNWTEIKTFEKSFLKSPWNLNWPFLWKIPVFIINYFLFKIKSHPIFFLLRSHFKWITIGKETLSFHTDFLWKMSSIQMRSIIILWSVPLHSGTMSPTESIQWRYKLFNLQSLTFSFDDISHFHFIWCFLF